MANISYNYNTFGSASVVGNVYNEYFNLGTSTGAVQYDMDPSPNLYLSFSYSNASKNKFSLALGDANFNYLQYQIDNVNKNFQLIYGASNYTTLNVTSNLLTQINNINVHDSGTFQIFSLNQYLYCYNSNDVLLSNYYCPSNLCFYNGSIWVTGSNEGSSLYMSNLQYEPMIVTENDAYFNRGIYANQYFNLPPNVSSFNGRSNAVILNNIDISSALGYVPMNCNEAIVLDPSDLQIVIPAGTIAFDYVGNAFVNDPLWLPCGTTVVRSNYDELASALGIPTCQKTFTTPYPVIDYNWLSNVPAAPSLPILPYPVAGHYGGYSETLIIDVDQYGRVVNIGMTNIIIDASTITNLSPKALASYVQDTLDIGATVFAAYYGSASAGNIVAGSALYYAGIWSQATNQAVNQVGSAIGLGTWRCQGYSNGTTNNPGLTLWFRVA
jgi:hypothetical protein